MYKNDDAEGSNLPQGTGRVADISGIGSDSPTPEQTFLYNLLNLFENIQDSIYDQSSPAYQVLEVYNPILFDIWARTRR